MARKKGALIGKEAWQIVGPNEEVLRETGAGPDVALVLAQTLALDSEKEVTLTVRLKPLFGAADAFYTVQREEDGSVITMRA